MINRSPRPLSSSVRKPVECKAAHNLPFMSADWRLWPCTLTVLGRGTADPRVGRRGRLGVRCLLLLQQQLGHLQEKGRWARVVDLLEWDRLRLANVEDRARPAA